MRALQRPERRLLTAIDAGLSRLYGWRWNPMHQPGTIAVAMLLVLLATGLYLVLIYRVGSPAASVAGLAADPWLGRWVRSLHRYASDLFVIAGVVHAVRIFGQDRSWGPRTLAWVSGLSLLGVGLVCAWTGFVMAWDSFGERLAREGARLLDAMPVFSEPLSRIFSGESPVPSAFFFVNLFLHIALPLGMGVALWLHVSRLARPVLLPPRRLGWAIVATLVLASMALPAPLGPAADPFRLVPSTPTDLVVAWWLPVSEALPAGVVWAVAIALVILAVLVPRFSRPGERRAASVVDPRLCTGCNQCPQDCPWEAITMVPRTDDRPTLVAQVDPDRCVSCGLCAGSCAPMGVGPPGLSGRDQVAHLREVVLPRFAATPPATGVVAICCAQVRPGDRAELRARGVQLHEVPCVGNLHSSVIELLIRHGVAGVLVCGCPPRDCVGREGPKWLEARLFNDREAELQPRVDRRRVTITTLAPGTRAEALQALDRFVDALGTLAPPVRDVDVAVEVACEPVPLEETPR